MEYKELQEKYGGKTIATKDFNSLEVIASGDDPIKVYNKAIKKCKEPVILYIFKKGEKFIFAAA